VAAAVAEPETLFYDGACGLCHRTVKFVLAHDRAGVFRFAPIGGPTFEAAVPLAARAGLPDAIVVKRADGVILVKSDATAHVLARLGGGWAFLGALLRAIPRAVREPAYEWVARRRRRWFEAPDDACPIVPAHLRARFVP
jgi:predicted DCC family thiol-disulfide oxidoreductase YuxK